MHDDLDRIDPKAHWLEWLGDDPRRAIRDRVEGILAKQVPGTTIDWMRVVDAPYYLTGGAKTEDGKRIIVKRAALCVAFEIAVRAPDHVEELSGAFSWVAVGLDGDERLDRVWLDLRTDFADACDALKARIYEIDAKR